MVDTSAKRIKLEADAEKAGDAHNELDEKIAKQLNYYFSDVNLVKDKFMREQLEKNENCVKLSVLATFARLAQLTKDEERMCQALKGFESEFMELDEEMKLIRRKKPLPNPAELQKELDLRTVHISGFPDSTLFESLQRFCNQYGEIDSLAMRRQYKTKQFKGCIHVTFKSQDSAKKVLESDVLLFKDRELRRESMEQYHKRKEEMMQKRRERKKNSRRNDDNENSGGRKRKNSEQDEVEDEKKEVKEDKEEAEEKVKEEVKEEEDE